MRTCHQESMPLTLPSTIALKRAHFSLPNRQTLITPASVSLGTWCSSVPEAVRRLAQNEPRMCSPVSLRPSDIESRLLCFSLSLP
ncbi:hypothetical protein ANTQUA_LOCUS8109 [Anthophora quadrimaculata]